MASFWEYALPPLFTGLGSAFEEDPDIWNYGGPTPEFGELDQMLQDMIADPGAIDEIMSLIQGGRPRAVLPAALKYLGVTPGQAGEHITNLMTGKGAAKRAGKWGDVQMDLLNRYATGAGQQLQQRQAETGGRGSSAGAREMATAKTELAKARGGVRAGQMGYEDRLKEAMFGRGTNLLGIGSSLARGDVGQGLQWLQTLLGGGQLALGAEGMDMNAIMQLMQFQQQISEYRARNEENPVEVPEFGPAL